ncbi:MAG TPA: prenyltransferase [Levilinea sp.]|nr:prenyltransferase [Levilinea sp.]
MIKSELKANLKIITGPMRLPFLVLAPACVFLGLGSAIWRTGAYNPLYSILALVGAIAAHISVNALNEYFDFKSGLDMKTTRTPFSGGSGTLPAHPEKYRIALQIGVATLMITALIGIYFISVWGWGLLPLGLIGLVVVYGYTTWLTRTPLLCLVAPGLGFGTLMVMGTHFALTGSYSWAAFFSSLVPFFLVSNLLLLNQFPDVEADASIGRRHYPIVLRRKGSAVIYVIFLLMTYLAIIASVIAGVLPSFTLLGLLTLVIAIPNAVNVYRNADDLAKLIPAMGMNVILNLLTPVLVAIGLVIG